jgi:hypothetical protein
MGELVQALGDLDALMRELGAEEEADGARVLLALKSLSREQKVIADKLDTLLSQVDNTKARLERIPQILKRFRQSVLAAAVSGRLTEEWRAASKVSSTGYELHRRIKDAHEANGPPRKFRGNASKPTEEAHDLSTDTICLRVGMSLKCGIFVFLANQSQYGILNSWP